MFSSWGLRFKRPSESQADASQKLSSRAQMHSWLLFSDETFACLTKPEGHQRIIGCRGDHGGNRQRVEKRHQLWRGTATQDPAGIRTTEATKKQAKATGQTLTSRTLRRAQARIVPQLPTLMLIRYTALVVGDLHFSLKSRLGTSMQSIAHLPDLKF